MSLNAVLGNALSGLTASQAALRAASNNVANVNTPGYARTTVELAPRATGGSSMGVEVLGVKRAADIYLQGAALRANSDVGANGITASALDRLQAQFGSLDDPGSLFSRLSGAFTSLSQAGVDPTLSVARLTAANDLENFFNEAERLSADMRAQRMEADGRINAALVRVNEILDELFVLNSEVQSLSAGGGDVTGAANRQSNLLDELSTYMDLRLNYQDDGRVVVRTGDGVLLMDNYAVDLTYPPSGTGAYGANYNRIYVQPPNGAAAQELNGHLASGEIKALLELRDETLPAIAEELGELVGAAADELNRAHNNAASVPAPNTLNGHNTGLDTDDLHHFTGQTTIAVTDVNGTLISRIDIDFDAGTISADGGAPFGIGNTVGTLNTALNVGLGANGSASFSGGVLSLTATNPAHGLSTLENEANPSDRAGRGFAHFFGLNDIVRGPRPAFFETGIVGPEWHTFDAGERLSYRVEAPDGRTALTVDITMVAGETFNDILTALNDPITGLGQYATYSLSATGELVETANPGFENFSIKLEADSTTRDESHISFSMLFGLTLESRAGRSEVFKVDSQVRTDSTRMSLAQLDLDAATVAGDIVLNAGDNRGAIELQAVLTRSRSFNQAGVLAGGTSNLQDYAARFAGAVGARAAQAESRASSAEALLVAAEQKRGDLEGVNLDEELANMTLFQTSYNASARMLQASKEMTDILLNTI